jgi:bacteriorhodopsin
MAIGEGHVKVGHGDEKRPFYYARYIDWALTTPLLLLDLLLLAGCDWTRIAFIIFLDLVMVITGLLGGLISSSYKWGFFAFGCLAYVGILLELLGPVRAAATRVSSETGSLFDQLAYWTLGLWTAYPVVWGLAEGAHIISLQTEIVLYAILDVSAKAIFGFWLLLRQRDEGGVVLGGDI